MKLRLTKSLRFHSMIIAFIFVFALLLLIIICQFIETLPFILVLFLAGTLGGVTNNYLRLRLIPANIVEFSNPVTNKLAIIQLYVSPVIAGAFGCIIYSLFVAGILKGALFPEFKGINVNFSNIVDLFKAISPNQNIDAAKAMVWAFVAGFSERLVPNIIDRIALDVQNTLDDPKKISDDVQNENRIINVKEENG